MDEAEKIEKALRSNDIIAEVIKLSASVDFKLDLYLGIQFGGPLRIDDFLKFIAPRLALAEKIVGAGSTMADMEPAQVLMRLSRPKPWI